MLLNRYCDPCREMDASRTITFKPPARKSARRKPVRDYANLHSGEGSGDVQRWSQVLEEKEFTRDTFKRMEGAEVNLEWIETDPSALKEPIVVEQSDGLGMRMPENDLTVGDIADTLGADTPVEVIGLSLHFSVRRLCLVTSGISYVDVATQSNLPGWNLGKWSDYYSLEPSAREKIRNVISLEISGTKLADDVLPPRLVRELDWVEKFWPNNKKGKGHAYPKVQLYCLMGVAGAWTVCLH